MSAKSNAILPDCVKIMTRVFKSKFMNKLFSSRAGWPVSGVLLLLAGLMCPPPSQANPTGGTVSQGTATFNTSGSQFTINQSSANTFINWQSFNIGVGQTTTFVQPTANSVAWNQINDVNPSQILGNLNANGYVVLQNQSGFFIGGSAVINTHGLLMTTAPTPAPDLSLGGPWSFNTPPPTAKIINYGQINISGGGTAYLIASDIENNGTISAPSGKIGLYAGQQVLVSMSPDGRGLSAQVTLPEGSVNNQGQLIADAGAIAAQAKMVNQNGLIQANSVKNVNGTIELVASDSLTLGASSVISAAGDPSASSPGGFVVLKSDNTFSDQSGSTISVAGQNGGQDGIVEVFGSGVSAGSIQSSIDNNYAVLINPYDLYLADYTDTSSSSPYLSVGDLANYSRIDLHALDNIELTTTFELANASTAAGLSLTAGNNIILDDSTAILAGRNWAVNLTAGTALASAAGIVAGTENYGIYLRNTAYIQGKSGDINLAAANEIQLGWLGSETTGANLGTGSITTTAGGNITATATYGNVNTGSGTSGYVYRNNAPYYKVATDLGGISTAAGGNVSIAAGGDVVSYFPLAGNETSPNDAGSGAFGSQAGNVTITAGGNVYGHYVVANGAGTIIAQNGNAGSPAGDITTTTPVGFALSLIKGSWTVNAPNGSIYLQEVRNPNGVFNESGSADSNPWFHLFDYSPDAALTLTAGHGVEILGNDLPRAGSAVPIILPPTLTINAGDGGFTLDQNITLFQSPLGNVNIATAQGGNFEGNGNYLFMSDSDNNQWDADNNPLVWGSSVHAATPTELDNPNPVVINISGSMNNVNVYTTKATQITVGKDMNNSSFVGANLHPSDVSFVKVAGKIIYSPSYSFQPLSQPITPIPYGIDNPYSPTVWNTIFSLLVDPTLAANLTVTENLTKKNYQDVLNTLSASQFAGKPLYLDANNNNAFSYFTYDGKALGYQGPMSQGVANQLNGNLYGTTTINGITYGKLTVLRFNSFGVPVVQNGHLVTDTVTFVDQNSINNLYQASQSTTLTKAYGLQIGGPGQFNVNAGSMSLGNSQGISSLGMSGALGVSLGNNFNNLADYTSSGADINVDVAGDLEMLTSRIVSVYGGDVTVSAGGNMNLGSSAVPQGASSYAFGIYTTGHSDVSVTAGKDININGTRIAAFNGGSILVKSLHGSVNVGNGLNSYVTIPLVSSAPFKQAIKQAPNIYYLNYSIYGSGIVTTSLPHDYQTAPGGFFTPGDISIATPFGNITSTDAGILQFSLGGDTPVGPTISLEAGTAGVAATPEMGNVDLGNSGVIGGSVNVSATGNVTGLVISRQDAAINTSGNFSGSVLSAGSASVSAGGSVSGTIIGVTGVSASGSSVDATLLSQNVSVGGGQAESTLGTSATASSTSQSAAGTASNDAKQQVATDTTEGDDQKKKKTPTLRRTSRVTVILSSATPAH